MTTESTSLDLLGFYIQNNQENKLEGHIEIGTKGDFKGDMYDPDSEFQAQEVKGHIFQEGKFVRLVILQSAPESGLQQRLYDLKSQITPQNLFSYTRRFEGNWEELDYRIDYVKSYKRFLEKIDSFNKGFNKEQRGYTEIELSYGNLE
jgi:hypothetical protein